MASLELRADRYRVVFRYGGKKHSTALNTASRREAIGLLGGVEKTLLRLGQGLIDLPSGADICSFVLTEGRRTEKPKAVEPLSVAKLTERYVGGLPEGTLEANSLLTVRIHMQHFHRILGGRFSVQSLQFEHLQDYVMTRSNEVFRGKSISSTTIRKELATLSGLWRWASRMGLLKGYFPGQGLQFPKTTEKPPFQTFAQIERQVARGGMTDEEVEELWNCLYLTMSEMAELLHYVIERNKRDVLYPLIAMAVHTGARRSELVRLRINDIEFDARAVLIREKKRVKGRRTTRRVPMASELVLAMKEWVLDHPGGTHVFCERSPFAKTESRVLTPADISHRLNRLLAGSKWEKICGWHVFRHSFASNCASMGVDQRLIDEWLGHQTEEMRKRYRHLLPSHQQKTIDLVFGGLSVTS